MTADNSYTILNVGGDEAGRCAKSHVLGRAGYRVVEATKAADVLRLVREAEPQLVVLNVDLLDQSGIELCRTIKTSPAMAHIMVLQISASSVSSLDRALGLDESADTFLTEPIEAGELLTAVRALLRLYQREEENRRLLHQMEQEIAERKRVELALRANEARLESSQQQFRDATEAANCAMWDWNMTTGQLDWLGAHERLAGLQPGSLNGSIEAFYNLLHPDDGPRVRHDLQAAINRRDSRYADEYRYLRSDGRARWMAGTGRFFYDDAGRPVRMTGVVQDIHERKVSKERLQSKTSKLALLADAAERLLTQDCSASTMKDLFGLLAPHFWLDSYWDYDTVETGEGLFLASSAGIIDEMAAAFRFLRFGQALCGTCAQERVPIVLERLQDSVDPKAALVKQNGNRAYACYPLIVEEQLLGTLGFASRSREAFEQEEIEFLGTIAHYVAMVKARRRTEAWLLKRNQRLELLASAAAALLTAEDAAAMMQSLFEMLRRHLGLDGYLAYAVDESEFTARLEACAGFPEEALPPLRRLEPDQALRGASGRRLVPLIAEEPPDADDPKADAMKRAGFLAYACHVLTVGERCLGVLAVGSGSKDRFDADETEFMRTICHYAAMAKERLRLLAEVRRREHMLLRAQRAAKAGLWEVDLRTDRFIWSDAYYELFQLDRSVEPSMDAWLARIHPDDRAGVKARYDQAIAEQQDQDFEYRILLPDGSVRWVHRKGQIERDDQGRPVRLTGLTFDTTEQKRGEEALRASEERWQLAINGSTDGMWDWDPRSKKVFLSSRWKALRGYMEDEIGDDIEEWSSRIHPDDVERVMRTVQLYFAKRIPIYECEYRSRSKNGSYRWINDRGEAVWDEQGQVVRMVGSEIDVTDRKRADERITELNRELGLRAQELLTLVERLRESEDQLRVITDSVPSLIAYVDRNERYQFVNAGYEALFGRPRHDIIGRSIKELTGESYDGICPHIARVLAGGAVSFESRVQYEGRDATMLASYTPDLNPDGSVSGFYILVTDISDRKRAEEALREFNVELEQRVDERTQELVRSQGRLRALATELNLSEQRQRQRLSEDLHDYLAQLLVFVRLKLNQAKRSGLGSSSMQFIAEADGTLSQALTYTRSLIAELSPPVLRDFGLLVALQWLADQMRRHEMTVSLERGVEAISLPEEQSVLLFQSVRELLINVSKHAGTNHAVVTVSETDGMLCIEVKDDGRGFDPYEAQLADSASSESSRYGLFSIRERMCAMGGDFDLESAPSRGTRATLVLPLAGAGRSSELGVRSSELAEGAGRSSELGVRSSELLESQIPVNSKLTTQNSELKRRPAVRVLLADDHAMLRQGLRSVLDAYADVEVVGEASDGEQAIVLAQSLQPEVIVMDVNMPGVDGIEATRQLRQEQPTIAVIGLSVHNNPQIEQAMREAGAAGFLTKESAVEQLYLAIQEALGHN